MTSRVGLVAAIVAVFLVCADAIAQQRPVLRAIVEDSTGGVIIGATVTVGSGGSQEKQEAVTDETGRVTFEGLAAGEYVLRVELTGFKTLERPVTLTATPAPPLRLRLEIELSAEEQVVGIRRIEATNPGAVDIDNDTISDMPLGMGSTRLFEYLGMFLSPAAQSTGGVSLVVDGNEQGRFTLPIASVKRLVVNKNPFSAEYKKPGKARVEVVTEDGSRQHFEGNAGLFFGSSALDARNALADTKPEADKALLEGGFSGPLIRNRGSFFVGWEYLRDNQNAVVNAQTLEGPVVETVPTSEEYGYGMLRTDFRPSPLLNIMARYDYAQEIQRNDDVGGLKLPSLAVNGRDIEHGLRFRFNSIFSPKFANDLRVSGERSTEREGGPATGSQVLVRGAFRGGSSQVYAADRATELQIEDTATWFAGAHTIRAGGRVKGSFVRAIDQSNFGGLFEFASLNAYDAGLASVYRVNQGLPGVDFSIWDADVFFQDEIKVKPSFTFMFGGRYERQSVLDDFNNVAPRLAFTWSPNPRTVLRGGAGIFYERMTERILGESLLYDGTRTSELVISNPGYPNPLASGSSQVTLPSVVRLAPGIETPYLSQGTVSIERMVWDRTFLTVEYMHLRGDRLFRSRNVNAPQPDTGVRADPRFLNINQVESTATLKSNAATFTLAGRIGGDFDITTNYTYSRAVNDASDPFSLPADNFDLGPERGRADFDIRHRFNLMTALELPADFTLGTIFSAHSGLPYDITTGFDDNRDTEATDRPAGMRRNSGRGFRFAQLDLRLMKEFDIGPSLDEDPAEPGELDFYIDIFNVLNRPNYEDVVGVRSSPLFGQPTVARPARTIQFSVKYSF